ncbi:hypothetical protein F383_34496 [Gossypium arboreum]|uniref:Uncharacterized protein n=1 Tax=Gossypium arboreum TaxID=29729 RepID=A0A0B0N684_GOSAR|nr:hypothetical protein F383_34496 [Gossypium arboreum]
MHKQRPDSTDEGSAQGNLERLYGGARKRLMGTTPWHYSGVFHKFLVFSVVDFLWVQLGLGFRVWVYSIRFKKCIWAAFNLIYYLGCF